MDWEQTASGYAAVWAKENTREALFDAMERKETYATTGPRMTVRFFGGWDFAPSDAQSPHAGRASATRKGVPMGGDLRDAPAGKAPTFLVAALKDPIGANLDRIQIVKGWLDEGRQAAREGLRRRVVRRPQAGADGKLPPVGNTVDVANATWTNTIGAPELIAVWKDPDFDRERSRAFYYGRVIEIPTPRWTAYDAKRFGVKCYRGPMTTTGARLHVADLVHACEARFLERNRCCTSSCSASGYSCVYRGSRRGAGARAERDRRRRGARRVARRRSSRARWQRAPTEQELQGLVDDYVRDEVSIAKGSPSVSIATTPSCAIVCGCSWSSSPTTAAPERIGAGRAIVVRRAPRALRGSGTF